MTAKLCQPDSSTIWVFLCWYSKISKDNDRMGSPFEPFFSVSHSTYISWKIHHFFDTHTQHIISPHLNVELATIFEPCCHISIMLTLELLQAEIIDEGRLSRTRRPHDKDNFPEQPLHSSPDTGWTNFRYNGETYFHNCRFCHSYPPVN